MDGEQINHGLGRKVRDVSQLVDVFEAQEGEVQQIIGKTGQGKTYEATRRALEYLHKGFVVYTTWHLILPEVYDERESLGMLIMRTLFFRKRFYKFDFHKNWHYIDIDRPDLIEYVANLTDCILMMDEGQDVFDARGGMDRPARKTITRTRHMRKTLIIISQRAQAVDVTARANVTYFFKCVKSIAWFWPFANYFKIYRTEEMDDQNYPIWEERMPDGKMWKASVWHSHFGDKKIYNAYNSWYLRAGIPKSQEIYFEAYDLSLFDKLIAIMDILTGSKKPKRGKKEKIGAQPVFDTTTGERKSIRDIEKPIQQAAPEDKNFSTTPRKRGRPRKVSGVQLNNDEVSQFKRINIKNFDMVRPELQPEQISTRKKKEPVSPD